MNRRESMVDVAAEKALLGALLRSEHDFWTVSDLVRADNFSVPLHREIYSVISDLMMSNRRLSTAVLTSRLPEEDGEGVNVAAILATLAHNADGLSAADFASAVAELAARRRLVQISAAIDKAARKGDTNSIDVAAEAESLLLEVMQHSAPKRPQLLYDLAVRVNTQSVGAKEGGTLPGFDTGLPTLDEILGLIMPGDLGAIIGAQGDGKSALATQIGKRISLTRPVCMFQLEMSDEQMAARELAAESDMTIREINEGAYSFDGLSRLQAGLKALQKPQFYILDQPKITVRQMRAQALAMKRSRGLGAVIVDHMRLVKGEGKARDRWDRQTDVTGDLKILAKELEVPVILLAQRTRTAQRRDDPTPQIDDADAPSLEQDCDWAIGVWRRENWLRRNRPPMKAGGEERAKWDREFEASKGVGEIITLKTRRGAAYEQRRLKWVGKKTRYEEL